MRTPLAVAGLSQAERGILFAQIAALDPDEVNGLTPARFGNAIGWLVSDPATARKVLTTSIGVKSRPAASQARLGGIGAREGSVVRSLKRQLLLALGSLADQEDLVLEHVAGALSSSSDPLDGLTDALTAATISLITGVSPGTIDRTELRKHVIRTWQVIEGSSDKGSRHDPFYDHLRGLLDGPGSRFLASLRSQGWTADEIAEEIRAMVLAGWGSTAAAVISAVSLGVASDLYRPFVLDEVLRLYPPSFIIGRIASGNRPGLPFKAGDTLVISPWLIHRRRHSWEHPLTFDPNRFRQRASHEPPGLLSFGLGARRCPASRFARTQARITGQIFSELAPPTETEVILVENRSPALAPTSLGDSRSPVH